MFKIEQFNDSLGKKIRCLTSKINFVSNSYAMQLQAVPIVDSIAPQQFADLYYAQQKPVVIKDLAKQWPAYTKWNWTYFKELVGHKKVGIYNNIKSDAYTPVNTADD